MRKVYIDVGAHHGQTAYDFAIGNPNHDIFCIEPNRVLIPEIVIRAFNAARCFNIICAAAWIEDGVTNLFRSGADAASTVVPGKVEPGHWPQIDYENGEIVPSFDYPSWLRRNFTKSDEILMKLDVEGAEYAILEQMLADDSIDLVHTLRCEWHADRFPAIGQDRHDAIRARVAARVNLVDWG